ncbi:unannotated protein [freshwater metagenome]|uniref:Unannotated protein n=1 Tax=freshwater metagenome TaxID=449393 RepID=A0A6J6TSA8_9ZZZZ
MQDWGNRVVDADHVPDLAPPHSGSVDHVLGENRPLLGLELPASPRALDPEDSVVSDDGCSAFPRGTGVGIHRPVGIEISLVRVEEAAGEPIGIDDRHEVDDLFDVEKSGTLVPHHLVPCNLGLEPAHALGSARELDATRELEPDVDATLLGNLRVHRDRVALECSHDGVVVDRVEPAGCMPTRSSGELGAFDEGDVGPALECEVVQDARPGNASTDHDHAK